MPKNQCHIRLLESRYKPLLRNSILAPKQRFGARIKLAINKLRGEPAAGRHLLTPFEGMQF